MFALGVDTSNYATSLAVVNTEKREVVYAVKRFLPVPQGSTGLRQSDSLFHHTIALPELFDELQSTIALHEVICVGVSYRPRPVEKSYMPCFLAGVNAAKAFAVAKGVKLHQTTHQQGHLAAALLGVKQEKLCKEDVLFFHVSGGTTELLLTNGYNIMKQVSESNDLYAGQAVDRLGVLFGYSFPAGENISRLAEEYNNTVKVKVSIQGMNCNLSGLENQCKTLLAEGQSKNYIAKYCLTYIAETIVCMIKNAREKFGELPVVCAGGVMCSTTIREYMLNNCDNVFFTPPELSADNAVGIAVIAGNEV